MRLFICVFWALVANMAVAGCLEGKTMVSKQVQVDTNTSNTVFEELTIQLGNLEFEMIAKNPIDPVAYPGGSGVSFQLSLQLKSGESSVVSLSKLSPPYQSTKSAAWGGYRLEFVDLGNDKHPSVILNVSKRDQGCDK